MRQILRIIAICSLVIFAGVLFGLGVQAWAIGLETGLINTVSNTPAYQYAINYDEWGCQFTRTGTTDVVVTLQGSKVQDGAFANIGAAQILNATDSDSLQFDRDGLAKNIRIHAVSGADLTNTVTGNCIHKGQ